jgi:hypothetical protein
MLKKKIWVNFQRIIEVFTQKIVTKLSKIWGLGSGGPGVKKAPDPGSATLVSTVRRAHSSLVSLVVIKVPSSPVMLDAIGINDAKHGHQ